MTPNVDQFLSDYFRALERRESPRTVSVEARRSGTYEAALYAQEAFSWASGIMGTLARESRLTEPHRAVLRIVYLSLLPCHVYLIRMRSAGEAQARVVECARLDPLRPEPPECSEVQSFTDWGAVAKAMGMRRREARALFIEARMVVAEELRERAERAAESLRDCGGVD